MKNPYKLDLEKLVKKHGAFYCILRMLTWITLIYVSVWFVLITMLLIIGT